MEETLTYPLGMAGSSSPRSLVPRKCSSFLYSLGSVLLFDSDLKSSLMQLAVLGFTGQVLFTLSLVTALTLLVTQLDHLMGNQRLRKIKIQCSFYVRIYL